MPTLSPAVRLINAMPAKERAQIMRSKKDFIVFNRFNCYILTNDLVKHRAQYIQGGTFAAIETIRQHVKS